MPNNIECPRQSTGRFVWGYLTIASKQSRSDGAYQTLGVHLFPRLERTVINLIKSGVCYFGAGGALGFDTMAAQTILSRETVTKYKPVD